MMRKSLILFSLLILAPVALQASPQGGTVVGGSASITSDQTQTIINQTSDRAIINWNSFNIGANESVRFNQLGSSSVALNRVIGTESSTILGQLSANGRVFLINPNGILFGAGSHIDVAGLVASTFDISNSDFMAGKYNFAQNAGSASSYVINQGNITVGPDGFVYLVAPGVSNSGIIAAQLGQVALASGNQFTVDFSGDGLMQFAVSGQILQQIKDPSGKAMSSAVSNTGTIQANGGSVLLTGDAANSVVASVVNNGGIIEAQSLTNAPGSVKLIGGAEGQVINTGTIDTSAAVTGVSGGSIQMQGYDVGQLGTLLSDAIDGGNGGNIDLYASDILALSSDSLTSANGGLNGNGGSVTAFSPDTTLFWGGAEIDAKGGNVSGNGGDVEVSGKQQDDVLGSVDTSAPNGFAGTLLIDPNNIVISTGGNNAITGSSPFDSTDDSSVLNLTTLESALASGNVIVQTESAGGDSQPGNITLSNALDFNGIGTHTLTLTASNDIDINAGIDDSVPASVDVLNLVLTAGGNVNIDAAINTRGGSFTSSGVNFASNGSGLITTGAGAINLTQTGSVSIGAAVSTSSTFTSTGTTFGNTGTINTGAGAINLTQSGAITVGADITTTGVANLTTTGSDENITSSSSSDILSASSSNLVASGSIGSSGTHFFTDLGILTTASSNDSNSGGGIYITNASGGTLALGTLTAGQTISAAENTFTPTVYTPFKNGSGDVVLSDPLSTVGSQNVEITSDEDIIVTGAIKASNLLDLTATSGNIYNSYSGVDFTAQTLNLTAADAIGQSAASLETSVQTVNAAASAGGVYLTEGDILTVGTITADGDVGIVVNNGNLTLGSVTATGGTATLTSTNGNITSSGGTNITGTGAVLSAKTGIGSSGTHVGTNVSTLSATTTTATTAPIYITNSSALTSVTAATDDSIASIAFSGGSLTFSSNDLSLSTGSELNLNFSNTDINSASSFAAGSITLEGGLDVDGGNVTLSAVGAITQADADSIDANTATLTAGTNIGTSGTPLLTDVSTLNLTAANGGIFDTQTGAVALTASASGTNKAVSVTNTSGNITIDSVTATGAVTLAASSGSIINGNGSGTDITGSSATLTASGHIGSSGTNNAINTHVAGAYSATGHGDVYLSNLGAISQFDANSNGSGNVSLINSGNVAVDAVSAAGNTLTIDATGNITDLNGLTDFTANTLNITGESIGTSGTPMKANISTLTALTTNGGIYLTQPSGGLTINTVDAVGSSGSNVAILADGNILLGAITAAGNDVTLTSTSGGGTITDDRTALSLTADPNVTSDQLSITAPGGIGTSGDALSLDVTHLTGSSAGSIYSDTIGPVLIDSSTFTGGGDDVTIDGQDITILDDSGGTMSTGGGDVTITADQGDVVFLNTADTIDADGGNITITADWPGCSSSCSDLLPGRVIVGNLTTSGTGNISINAYSDISIGNLTAGNSGTVSVDSSHGLILGNSPSTTTITAGTVDLTATLPSATALADARSDLVSAYSTASSVATSDLTLEETWSSNYTELSSLSSETAATEASDQSTFDSIDSQLDSANSTLSSDQTTDEALNGTLTAAAVVVTAAQFISGAAQAIPFSGDAGADEVFAGISAIQAAAQLAVWAFEQTTLADAQNNAATLQSEDDVASANLSAATEAAQIAAADAAAADSSLNIATAAENAAVVAQEHAAQTRLQAIDAASTANAIGTSSLPLIVQTGHLNITGTNTSAYVQSPTSTTLNLGTISLPGTGTELYADAPGASGNISILDPVSATSLINLKAGDAINTSGGSLTSGSLLAQAGNGISMTNTAVGNVAANGGTGGVVITNSNSSTPLYITTVDDTTTSDSVTGVTGEAAVNVSTTGDLNVSQAVNTTVNNANVSLSSSGGNVNVNAAVTAHGSGGVTVTSSTGTATLAALVSSTTGNIAVTGHSIAQNAGGNITTGGTGTVTATATSGGITMADGTTTTAASGLIDYDATAGVALSKLIGTGNVDVTAGDGTSVGAITDNTAAELANIVGSTATLDAQTGIGVSGAGDIDTDITTLVATNHTSGNIYVKELDTTTNDGLTIGGTGVRTLAGNGIINIDDAAGNLTVNDVVTANGSGNVTLTADAGSVTLGAVTSSTTGSIAVTGTSIAQNSNITTGGTGTVTATATSGGITMADGTTTTAASGLIDYDATAGVALSKLIGTGNVDVTAGDGTSVGAITDNTAAELANIVGSTATLDAQTGIGASGAGDIDTDITTLVATNHTSGNIYVKELDTTTNDGLTIGGTGVRTLAGNGTIHIDDAAGNLLVSDVVTANGSGAVTLISDAGSATLNAVVSSTTGSIAVTGTSIAQNSNITTGGTGTVTATATSGGITMADGTTTTAASGLIDYDATAGVALSKLIGTGNVDVTAGDGTSVGAITDNTAAELANIVGSTATLDAQTGIGASGAGDIDTDITTLVATNHTSGNIYVKELDTTTNDGLTIGGTGVRTLAGNGIINIDDAAGNLTVNDVVTANGSGNVTLTADAGSVTLGAVTSSTTGSIAVTGTSIAQNSNITTGGTGTVTATATSGGITMADGTTTTAASGLIDYDATAGVALSKLIGTGNVDVTAGDGTSVGAITDNTAAELANIVGSTATLDAQTGIGASGAGDIDTDITTLVATNHTSGNIYVKELDTTTNDGLTIGGTGVRTLAGNGIINIDVASGNVTQNDAITANGSGNVTLTANSGSITMTDGTTTTSGSGVIDYDASAGVALSKLTTTGNVDVTAGDGTSVGAITDNTAAELANIVGSTATLDAQTGIGASGAGDIDTDITTLVATNHTSGNIYVKELDTTTNDGLTIGGTGVRTLAGNGIINIDDAAGNLTVNDVVTANGSGNVILTADAGSLTLNAAASTTSGNILISSTGASSDLNLNSDVTSGSGHITLLAGRSLITASGANVTTTGGTIDAEAAAGSITMNANSLFSAGSGNIRLLGSQNVSLGGLLTTGDASVTATNGSILNSGNTDYVNVVADGLRLSAGDGIGTSTDSLDTTINTVSGRAAADGINILDNQALIVDDVSVSVDKVAGDGSTSIVTDGTQSDLRTSGGGAVTIRTTSGNITLNDGTAPLDNTAIYSTGNVSVEAAGSVNQNADITATGSNNISVTADTGNITMSSNATTSTGSGTITYTANNGTISTNDFSGNNVNLNAGNITNGNGGNITANNITVNSPSVTIGTLGSLVSGGNGGTENITADASIVGGTVNNTILLVPLSLLNSNYGSAYTNLSLQDIVEGEDVPNNDPLLLQL